MDDQGDDKRRPGMPPGLSARRIPSQNVVSRLMSRQMFGPHYRYGDEINLRPLRQLRFILIFVSLPGENL